MFGLLFILLLSTAAIWIAKIISGELPYVDQVTRRFVEKIADTSVYTFFRWMTEFGSSTFVIPFTVIMIIVLWVLLKDYLSAIFFGIGTLGSHLLNQWMKEIVARERPSISEAFNAVGYSFPSGHAMVSIVCYGLVAYFLCEKYSTNKKRRTIKIGFSIFVLLIGLSRYIINVHYLTDIVAGYLFGFTILFLLVMLYEKMKK